MTQPDALRMIHRRAVAVGIHAPIGNHNYLCRTDERGRIAAQYLASSYNVSRRPIVRLELCGTTTKPLPLLCGNRWSKRDGAYMARNDGSVRPIN
jgi:hypothetical protein